ncbi:MAG: phosphoribosylaminoimidazolesuccinocarboxamide synthase [Spirochaetales bacterium]|nr:phosphoribosylaminoimidazolesuccinocarboxamide synthase [Spirochaetales bacterium]
MEKGDLSRFLDSTLEQINIKDISAAAAYKGKVRDILDFGSTMLICTTDRISAFDKVLGTIPCKGQVLNQISLYWFNQTADILKNHILEELSPRAVLVKKSTPLPVEVVVRGYLTGSAWRDYQKGNSISGIRLPSGMKFNQRFETPLLTPSTKAERGTHDLPISPAEIISSGIVERSVWEQVEEKALALFKKGTELAGAHGLILVDTKYEFGMNNGELILIDEIHTPDSSRYWYSNTYEQLFNKGEKQRKLDKEYLRQWLMEHNYMGDGEPPHIPDEIRIHVAWLYITAFETITGRTFIPTENDEKQEIDIISQKLSNLGYL